MTISVELNISSNERANGNDESGRCHRKRPWLIVTALGELRKQEEALGELVSGPKIEHGPA
jgi:hypothetical protein